MRLIVATPGVSLAMLRERVGLPPDGLVVCVRTPPCGRLPVDPRGASELFVVTSRCAASIHAADRVLDTAPLKPRSRAAVYLDEPSVPPWLRARFSVPVRSLEPVSGSTRREKH